MSTELHALLSAQPLRSKDRNGDPGARSHHDDDANSDADHVPNAFAHLDAAARAALEKELADKVATVDEERQELRMLRETREAEEKVAADTRFREELAAINAHPYAVLAARFGWAAVILGAPALIQMGLLVLATMRIPLFLWPTWIEDDARRMVAYLGIGASFALLILLGIPWGILRRRANIEVFGRKRYKALAGDRHCGQWTNCY